MDVRVYLFVISNPVIENCSAIAFAEYPSFASLLNPFIDGALPPNVSISFLIHGLFFDKIP